MSRREPMVVGQDIQDNTIDYSEAGCEDNLKVAARPSDSVFAS